MVDEIWEDISYWIRRHNDRYASKYLYLLPFKKFPIYRYYPNSNMFIYPPVIKRYEIEKGLKIAVLIKEESYKPFIFKGYIDNEHYTRDYPMTYCFQEEGFNNFIEYIIEDLRALKQKQGGLK